MDLHFAVVFPVSTSGGGWPVPIFSALIWIKLPAMKMLLVSTLLKYSSGYFKKVRKI